MAYERQYYTNGDVLDARKMNHMETGIKENSDNISKLSEEIADYPNLKLALKTYFTNVQTLISQLVFNTENHVGQTVIKNAKDIVTALETTEEDTKVTVSQNGTTLVLSGVDTITTISQSGSTLALA